MDILSSKNGTIPKVRPQHSRPSSGRTKHQNPSSRSQHCLTPTGHSTSSISLAEAAVAMKRQGATYPQKWFAASQCLSVTRRHRLRQWLGLRHQLAAVSELSPWFTA
ncbi:unnamed protein product [Protopolystoma xenopodis]|uniref:Uncharacterized protein n=1 Tax=Protopolystoma xenopodis TaxID=117903 RepID=A0A448WPG4_9PLAT|nr:unnamed protein product [Protopolystoma xenopodis]